MKLLWIKYQATKGTTFALYLVIAENGSDYVALKSTAMDQSEIARVRHNHRLLSNLDLEDRTNWLKQQCPSAMRSAFRKLKKSKAIVLKSYTPK